MVLWGLALLVFAAQSDTAERLARVHYTLDASNPASERVGVEMAIEGVLHDPLVLGIPAWRPGSYRYQRYHEWYEELSAEGAGGEALTVTKKDKLTYEIDTRGASSLTVRYTLKPARGDLTDEHFHIDAVGVYPYLAEYKHAPCRVKFSRPEKWEVATGLTKNGDWYEARDYDTFADCPTELGIFEMHVFEQDGVRHEVMIHGPTDFNMDDFLEMHKKIVAEQYRMFGGAPFDRYVFLYHFNNRFGGYGLEHLNSTIIQFHAGALEANVRSIAALTSHEFFHLWNVKRIRPKMLGPFDYSRDVRTRALWWSEGVTDYYGHLTLARAGIYTEGQFLAQLANEIAQLQGVADRRNTSVEEASWRIWDGYREVDYYNKGLLLGMLIDLRMRRLTGGRKTLDDVMRFLHDWFVKGGGGPIGVGFEEGDLLRAVNAVSGHDFTDFFARYVSGTEELPYAEELAAAGLALDLEVKRRPDHGISLREDSVRRATGPAATAGLQRGDRIVAVNGASAADVDEALSALEAGKEATLTVERDGEKIELTLAVKEREDVARCAVEPSEAPTAAMKAIRRSWVTGRD